LLYLEHLDEIGQIAALVTETQKRQVKAQYDKIVTPHVYVEGDFVLLYDQANNKLGVGKFEPMWYEPYIVKHVLQKGAYELVDYDGNQLSKPHNGLYLKRYYA